jgi:phage terminase large subunit-like protein
MTKHYRQTTLSTFVPHPAQSAVLESGTRHRVVACGRRWGKTALGQHEILMAASQNKTTWWLAPTYAMADPVWHALKATRAADPRITIHESHRRLDFPAGGSITIHSTHHPDNLRGAGLDFVVLDEAAFMHPTVWPEIVRPMLLDRKGRALFLSSPNGKNSFWELYQLGLRNARTWRSFHFPTSANPLLDPADLEIIRQQTPERIWLTEYLAEFTDDQGHVFRDIRAAATAPLQVDPIPGTRYVVGLDWGRDVDYTALVVIDTDRSAVVHIERFNQTTWQHQRGRILTLYHRWQPHRICAEANAIGSPNIEALQAEGLPIQPFTTTARSKPDLIDSLALALERRDLTLPPDETLLGELSTYTYQRLPSGTYRYTAPPGHHDDLVIALALAWHIAHQPAFTLDFA